MTPYDIEKAFADIENEIIKKMIDNFRKYRAKEKDGKYEWQEWRAKQIQASRRFRKEIKSEYKKIYRSLNTWINKMIGDTFDEAVKQSLVEAIDNAEEDDFYHINRTRMEALQKATKHDLETVESAVFTKTYEDYKQIIYKAQVGLNSGLYTYEQAVDVATNDFLKAGINCIEYSNGSRHTVREYAKMVLRTAMTRARLMADGEIRTQIGVHTVYAHFREEACPFCIPYLGRIMIDDVYSVGTRAELKNYPKRLRPCMLSEAMANGFLHPNCKDIVLTYDYDLYKNDPDNDPLKKSISKAERSKVKKIWKTEVAINNAENKVQFWERKAVNQLDANDKRVAEANKRIAEAEKETLEERLDELIDSDTPEKIRERRTADSTWFNDEDGYRFIKVDDSVVGSEVEEKIIDEVLEVYEASQSAPEHIAKLYREAIFEGKDWGDGSFTFTLDLEGFVENPIRWGKPQIHIVPGKLPTNSHEIGHAIDAIYSKEIQNDGTVLNVSELDEALDMYIGKWDTILRGRSDINKEKAKWLEDNARALIEEADREGVSLEAKRRIGDIYSALSIGRWNKKTDFIYGMHFKEYWEAGYFYRATEIFAEYLAIAIIDRKAYNLLRRYEPELCKVLDDLIISLTKGGY